MRNMLEITDILSSIITFGCVYRFIESGFVNSILSRTIKEYTNIIVGTIKTDKIYLA